MIKLIEIYIQFIIEKNCENIFAKYIYFGMTFDLIDQNAQIQSQIVEYLNLVEDNEEMFEKLIELFTKYQIGREKYELELLLCLLVRTFNNMHRTSTFFDKIFKILNYIKQANIRNL